MNIWLSIGCLTLVMLDELAIFREDVSRYTNGRYSLMIYINSARSVWIRSSCRWSAAPEGTSWVREPWNVNQRLIRTSHQQTLHGGGNFKRCLRFVGISRRLLLIALLDIDFLWSWLFSNEWWKMESELIYKFLMRK